MRIQLTNASSMADALVSAIVRFCADHFSVPGRVRIRVSNSQRRIWSGYCIPRRRAGESEIVVRTLPALDEGRHLPFEVKTLGYFRQHSIPITPYTITTRTEAVLHVVAHEMAHLMRRGLTGRKSRYERFCENRATEVLEAFRTDAGRRRFDELQADATPKAPAPRDIERDKAEAAAKARANIEARLKRWRTKHKRAATAIAKLERKLRRLDRQLTNQ